MGAGRNLDTPPPQTQGSVPLEQVAAVCLLLKFPSEELIFDHSGVDTLFDRRGAVLEPILSPHCHGQVDSGQQTEDWADDQSRGVAIVHHGLTDSSNCKQGEGRCHFWLRMDCIDKYFVVEQLQPQQHNSEVMDQFYSLN